MDKKNYSVPEFKAFVLALPKGGVICSSLTTYETTLENWEEETIQ